MTGNLDHHLGENLALVVEGGSGLDPARKAEIDQHVAGCPSCQAAIASAAAVFETVGKRSLPEPSAGFDRALFARLDAIDRQQGGSLFERVRALFTLPRVAFAAAAIAVIIGVIIVRPRPKDTFPSVPIELAQNLEGLRVAEDLDLLRDLDVVENLDVLDDLDVIRSMEDGEAG
jgi:hypothetical protein